MQILEGSFEHRSHPEGHLGGSVVAGVVDIIEAAHPTSSLPSPQLSYPLHLNLQLIHLPLEQANSQKWHALRVYGVMLGAAVVPQ